MNSVIKEYVAKEKNATAATSDVAEDVSKSSSALLKQ
jgi:hypothetical protein